MSGNHVTHVELFDCLLTAEAISQFSVCLLNQTFLSNIVLDYNEIGDNGCLQLCKGLLSCRTVVSLSLNYCKIGSSSSVYLAEIINNTALKELYLDGNDLKCKGAYDLIRDLAMYGEIAQMKREFEERKKFEEDKKFAEELANRLIYGGDMNATTDTGNATEPGRATTVATTVGISTPGADKKKKKSKRKRSARSKTPRAPLIGPFIHKLHLADNSIDLFETGSDIEESLNIVHQTIETFAKLIKYSDDLEELDLHNNTIGNISAKMILAAIKYRQEKKMKPVSVGVSEKIESEIHAAILKSSKPIKKKKRRKKKKK